jgi:hypothetical protein
MPHFYIYYFLFNFVCEDYYYCCSECTQNIYNSVNEDELVKKVLKEIHVNETTTIIQKPVNGTSNISSDVVFIFLCSIGLTVGFFLILFFIILCQLIQKNKTLEKKYNKIYKYRIDTLFNPLEPLNI